MATFFKVPYYGGDPEKEVIRIDKIGKSTRMPTGWERNISAVLVDEGVNVCFYDKQYLQGYTTCIGPGDYPDLRQLSRGNGNWHDVIRSFHIRKDCDQPKWIWDKDCFYADPERTIGNCRDKNSQCFRNRVMHCNKSDNPDENCLNFCVKNQGECDQAISKYCKKPENKDKDVCSCLNSPARKYNPLCIDSRCARIGYATNSMLRQPCPAITDCGIYYDIKGTGGNIDFTDASLEQRCSSNTNTAVKVDLPPDHYDRAMQDLKELKEKEKVEENRNNRDERNEDKGGIWSWITGFFMHWIVLLILGLVVISAVVYFVKPMRFIRNLKPGGIK